MKTDQGLVTHNLLIQWLPGADKSMLTHRLATILSVMTMAEVIETSRFCRVARHAGARTTVPEDAPMRCPSCDADTPDRAKFCIECGTPLRPDPPQCGADVLPRAKFCAACRTPLTVQSPASPAAPSLSPLSYTPGYLAEKILTYKSALEGERKQVTVLFADLKDSTAGARRPTTRNCGLIPCRPPVPTSSCTPCWGTTPAWDP